jgi:cytochrome c biogenesis protein CcmG/thiol:disulfide interchange protein DsbE
VKRLGPLPLAVIGIALLLVGLLVYGVAASGDGSRTLDDKLAKGQSPAAPDRTLPVLGKSGTKSLKDFRGKLVVLNFWASWCDPCRDEADVLEDVQQQLVKSGQGTVLGVTFRDVDRDSLKFVKEYGLSYPSLRDVDGELTRDYGATGIPETFVIDREGNIVHAVRNAIDKQFYDREIEPLL